MLQIANLRNAFILTIVSGSLFFIACKPGLLSEGTVGPSCSDGDLEHFSGCFGDPTDRHIVFDSWARYRPGDADRYCNLFGFAGHGSGIFVGTDVDWTFTGSLSGRDGDRQTAEIGIDYNTIDTEAGWPQDADLKYISATDTASEAMEIEWTEGLDTPEPCPPPERCVPHETRSIEGCFRDENGEHWIAVTVPSWLCNRVEGRIGGVFSDFSGADTVSWFFDGYTYPYGPSGTVRARLGVQSIRGHMANRTVEIYMQEDIGSAHLRVIGEPAALLAPEIADDSESAHLIRNESGCPPCIDHRTDLLLGSFAAEPDLTPIVADTLVANIGLHDQCRIEGSGTGVFSPAPDSEWENWTFEGEVTGDNYAEIRVSNLATGEVAEQVVLFRNEPMNPIQVDKTDATLDLGLDVTLDEL